jgi:hypothetical protein
VREVFDAQFEGWDWPGWYRNLFELFGRRKRNLGVSYSYRFIGRWRRGRH